ncbi:MAG: hypothetical protein J6W37_08640 [Bacteroidales bacterium]|nr:hypothetical protein [Bacteroidales bacterium]
MEYSQNIEFNKIRTTSEIFSDYWRFMKVEWRPYCLVLGVFVLPFAFFGAYLFSQQLNEVFALATMDGTDMQNEFVVDGSSVKNILLAVLSSFVAKFMGMFVSCAYVIKYMSNEQLYVLSKERFGIDSFLPFISQYGLVALLATIVMTVSVSFGFMLFIIPGLIFLPPMSLLVYDVFITKSCFASFSRCINLCKTNWRQSFGVVFLCYFAIVILSMILGGLIPSDNSMANILLSSVLTVVSETVMIPFIFLYYSLANQNMRL